MDTVRISKYREIRKYIIILKVLKLTEIVVYIHITICNILIILKLRSNQTFSFTYYKKKKCRQNGVTAKLNEERDFFYEKLTLK